MPQNFVFGMDTEKNAGWDAVVEYGKFHVTWGIGSSGRKRRWLEGGCYGGEDGCSHGDSDYFLFSWKSKAVVVIKSNDKNEN